MRLITYRKKEEKLVEAETIPNFGLQCRTVRDAQNEYTSIRKDLDNRSKGAE